MRALKFVIPLVVFALLAGFLAVGLQRDPREVPSPFIGKAAPDFRLEQLHDEKLAAADAGRRIDMTAHKTHYPTIPGPGMAASTVSRMFEVMERRADR